MPPQLPGGRGGPCSAFANPTLSHKQSRGQDTGRVPSSSKRSVFFWHLRISRRATGFFTPPDLWLGFGQPLFQDECMGPFPPSTCVRSASFWPLSNCQCCYFLCVIFCVFVGVTVGGCSAHWGKREEALWHKIPRKKKN